MGRGWKAGLAAVVALGAWMSSEVQASEAAQRLMGPTQSTGIGAEISMYEGYSSEGFLANGQGEWMAPTFRGTLTIGRSDSCTGVVLQSGFRPASIAGMRSTAWQGVGLRFRGDCEAQRGGFVSVVAAAGTRPYWEVNALNSEQRGTLSNAVMKALLVQAVRPMHQSGDALLYLWGDVDLYDEWDRLTHGAGGDDDLGPIGSTSMSSRGGIGLAVPWGSGGMLRWDIGLRRDTVWIFSGIPTSTGIHTGISLVGLGS